MSDTPAVKHESVSVKIERRGESTYRLVYTIDVEGKRETIKTPWVLRSRFYATANQYTRRLLQFTLAGMGRIPGNAVKVG